MALQKSNFYINNTTNDTILSIINFYNTNSPAITSIPPRQTVLAKQFCQDTLVSPTETIKQVTFTIFDELSRIKEQLTIDTIDDKDWSFEINADGDKNYCYLLKKDTTLYYFVNTTKDSTVLQCKTGEGTILKPAKQNDTVLIGATLSISHEFKPALINNYFEIMQFDRYGNYLTNLNKLDTNWCLMSKNKYIYVYQ